MVLPALCGRRQAVRRRQAAEEDATRAHAADDRAHHE